MSIQDYGRAGETAAPSPSIWKDFPIAQALKTPGRYIHIWDDFEGGTAIDVAYSGKFEVVGTNADIDVIDDEINGVIYLAGSGADNDSSFLKSNVLYDLTMNNGKRFWFETRVKSVDVSLDHSLVAGLGEPAFCTAEGLADGGATVIDEDFVGFAAFTDATNMGGIDAIYNEGGSGTTSVEADVHTPVDDTYVKLGLRFDGKKTLTYYVNGAVVCTVDVDDLSGNSLTNPLCVFVGMKDNEVSGFTAVMQLDWIRFACEKFASGI